MSKNKGTGSQTESARSAAELAGVQDYYTVQGLSGHWHRTLDLPGGFQHFDWYKEGANPHGVYLNDPKSLMEELEEDKDAPLYLYTQHQIFLQDGILKHTRSSPQWEGGLVTYSTCKHLMRTYTSPSPEEEDGVWRGVWLAGLCPKDCADNTVLFVGCIWQQFPGNYSLGNYLRQNYPAAYKVKRATGNPRGDLYSPSALNLLFDQPYDHNNFTEPNNHTRSIEHYKKSPGSKSERTDGKIPKWWRDLEYLQRGRRPPSFILNPCYLFSNPTLWTSKKPKRAVLKLTCGKLLESLSDKA